MKNSKFYLQRAAIIISTIWILVELIWYYKKIDWAIDLGVYFKNDYVINYFFLFYLGASVYLRLSGIIKYFTSKQSWFINFYLGQLMAIAIIFNWGLGLEVPVLLGKTLNFNLQILLLFSVAYFDENILEHINNKRQKLLLFSTVTVSLVYCFLRIGSIIYIMPYINSETFILLHIIIILTTSLTVYGLILIYKNYYDGFKYFFIGTLIELAIQIVTFVQNAINFSDMNEDEITTIIRNFILIIGILILLGYILFFYKKKFIDNLEEEIFNENIIEENK